MYKLYIIFSRDIDDVTDYLHLQVKIINHNLIYYGEYIEIEYELERELNANDENHLNSNDFVLSYTDKKRQLSLKETIRFVENLLYQHEFFTEGGGIDIAEFLNDNRKILIRPMLNINGAGVYTSASTENTQVLSPFQFLHFPFPLIPHKKFNRYFKKFQEKYINTDFF